MSICQAPKVGTCRDAYLSRECRCVVPISRGASTSPHRAAKTQTFLLLQVPTLHHQQHLANHLGLVSLYNTPPLLSPVLI